MRYLAVVLFVTIASLAGCSTTSNNANMRGANTNTGYTTNSETNAKPAVPANPTNLSPDAVSSAPAANHNSNAYVVNANNSNVKKASNANTKK